MYINSLDRSTKSTTSHINSALSVCKHRVSCSISLPSRGSFHLSLTVLISIGHQGVFSLMGWSPLFHTRFHVPRTTLSCLISLPSFTGLSPSSVCLPRQFFFVTISGLRNFRLFRFRSPLLTESSFLSFPIGT